MENHLENFCALVMLGGERGAIGIRSPASSHLFGIPKVLHPDRDRGMFSEMAHQFRSGIHSSEIGIGSAQRSPGTLHLINQN